MARMSKTTYEQFAALMAGTAMPDEARRSLEDGMLRIFRADNPLFHAGKFLEAADPANVGKSKGAARPVLKFGAES